MNTLAEFPLLDGPSIPWALIAPHEGQARRNHDQTLKRLAERGGLSVCEAVAVLHDRKWFPMTRTESMAALKEIVDCDLRSKLAAKDALLACKVHQNERQQSALQAYEDQVVKLEGYLERANWRRCDIAACNCNGYHNWNPSRAEIEEPLKDQLEAKDAEIQRLTAEKPLLCNNTRLLDLVRYMRSELHHADLITEDEYAALCMDVPNGSPRRLEDYDQMRDQLKSQTELLREACELQVASQCHIGNLVQYVVPEGAFVEQRARQHVTTLKSFLSKPAVVAFLASGQKDL